MYNVTLAVFVAIAAQNAPIMYTTPSRHDNVEIHCKTIVFQLLYTETVKQMSSNALELSMKTHGDALYTPKLKSTSIVGKQCRAGVLDTWAEKMYSCVNPNGKVTQFP